MQNIPPLDPSEHNLEPLLAAAGRTSDWLNTDDGDPYSPPNVARRNIIEALRTVPFHYRKATVDQPQLQQWINELAADAIKDQQKRDTTTAAVTRGKSVLLLGPTGVGKTHQAYGAVRQMAVTGVNNTWVTTAAADLYAELRPRHGVDTETEFRRYRDARILLVDDLGAGRAPTEFTEEINFRLVNWRYERHLPTLITTNVLPKELSARLGDRVASRLNEMCTRVVIKGEDRRRQVAA